MEDNKVRAVYRSLFTKDANVLMNLLDSQAPLHDLNARFTLLAGRFEKLDELSDTQVEELFNSDEYDEAAVERELEKIGEYNFKFLSLKERVEELNGKAVGVKVAASTAAEPLPVQPPSNQLRLKLKREVRQFDGQVRNWIKFWSQFAQIHDDDKITPAAKFDFLLQYIKPGSLAEKLIENFPPSGENYPKAIDLLKSRCGKDEALIEYYVREMLGLVLKARDGVNIGDFYDQLEAQLRALESLKMTTDKYAAILFPLVESAVPAHVFRTWERYRVDKGASMSDPGNCLSELMAFLKVEVESEERMKLREESSLHAPVQSPATFGVGTTETSATAASLVAGAGGQAKTGGSPNLCVFCEKPHSPQDCSQAANMDVEGRFEVLRKKKACFKCLRRGHQSQQCEKYVKCFHCKGRHFAMICKRISLGSDGGKRGDNSSSSTVALATSDFKGPTYLQTCRALVVTAHGDHVVRILLDSGSQQSYITYRVANLMGLKPSGRVELTQKLFGGKETLPKLHQVYRIDLKSFDGSFQGNFSVIGQDCICDFSPPLAPSEVYDRLRREGIALTDCIQSGSPNLDGIDILLGSDAWPKLVTNHVVNVNPNLVAVRTTLGWTLLGLASQTASVACNLVLTLTCQSHPSHFWDLELLGIRDPAELKKQHVKDDEVIRFFKETISKDNKGRLMVRLPWVECRPQIDDNRRVAEKRLHSTTNRLQKMGRFEDYDRVLKDWLDKGIVEEVDSLELSSGGPESRHYLPHRAVIKSSGSTKVRPVFDASCKDANGVSLNILLETGPNLIELIPVILTNFRLFKIGVIADIEAAFLQIAVDSIDRNMLRFLWWKNGNIITLRHCRVVFGLSCSPFLLGAVLGHIFDNADHNFAAVSQTLKNSFYVDNLLCGVQNEQELDYFIENSKRLLWASGFNLRGWADNIHNPENVESTLGLNWYCGPDQFGCNLERLDGLPPWITKRVLLSVSQRLHDPIGFTAPASLLPKLLYQEACEMKLDWDDQLPREMGETFDRWVAEIDKLALCKIPRRIIVNDSSTLHVFCDASKKAFACCVFVRTKMENGVHLSLVLAKTRVAPSKVTSIPRLELLAALIGVRISNVAKRGLRTSLPTYYWSDSAVVVEWIKGNGKWSVFVHNRVKEITDYTLASQWRHLPGSANPADLLSRGCRPSQVAETEWWTGPKWLLLEPEDWPMSFELPNEIKVNSERRTDTVVTTVTTEKAYSFTNKLAKRWSSYSKIIRHVSIILKFLAWKLPSFSAGSPATCGVQNEFLDTEVVLFRAIQKDCLLKEGEGRLKDVPVYRDVNGVLRLKTRVLDDSTTEDYQFPVILVAHHELVIRLIEEEHKKDHAGVASLMVMLRERVWLLRGRQVITRVVRRCLACKKQRAKHVEVPFPPLPRDRTKIAGTFHTTGLDLAGPLHLKSGGKAWIVIFTCAVYRAVHLEVVLALSTDALIQAFRRFIARRGRPSIVYSDNGTNLVGLENSMSELNWDELRRECHLQRIKWKFNVPTGAWWGGFWERLIRILKDLLLKNLGRALLDYVELSTLLCDCEAVMNSRPLTYVSEDPNELAPLTPSMFLISVSHNDVGDLDKIESLSHQSRLRYLQEVRQGLRNRFKREYLGFLRANGGPKYTDTVAVGDIVLVENEKKRLHWLMARVIDVQPGRDGFSRVCKLKTPSGELVRPVQRLYPLEIRVEDANTAVTNQGAVEETDQDIDETDEDGDNVDSEIEEEENSRLNSSEMQLPRNDGVAACDVTPSPTNVHSRAGRRIKPRDILDFSMRYFNVFIHWFSCNLEKFGNFGKFFGRECVGKL